MRPSGRIGGGAEREKPLDLPRSLLYAEPSASAWENENATLLLWGDERVYISAPESAEPHCSIPMTPKILRGHCDVGAVLLLVLLTGAALASVAAPAAAVVPDSNDSAVFEHDSSTDPALSTPPAEIGPETESESPITATGSVMTTGDAVMGTDVLRAQGLTGAGIRIGVISDGVDGIGSSQTSGDLDRVWVLSDEHGGGEGTAMLEIIHDVAPQAELYFHDNGGNASDFNRAIDNLVAAGCTVIVDDITWLNQPFFEKGEIADHLENLLTTHRLVYVTSAGNYGDAHYQGSVKINSRGYQGV